MSLLRHSYWRANRLLIAILLAIWATVSFFLSIFWAESLYELRVGNLPMSFWWAHQGSMFVFVILIFVYAVAMDRIDRKYDVHEEPEEPEEPRGTPRNPRNPTSPEAKEE